MLLSFNLDHGVACEKLCEQLQRAINIYQQQNDMTNTVLVIDIKKVVEDSSHIQKLEYKNIVS